MDLVSIDTADEVPLVRRLLKGKQSVTELQTRFSQSLIWKQTHTPLWYLIRIIVICSQILTHTHTQTHISVCLFEEKGVLLLLRAVSDECHTSGNFTGKPGQFVWSTGVMLPPPGDPLWQPGQPAENNWNFSCVTMIKTNTSLYFNDAECHIVAHAMCEKY